MKNFQNLKKRFNLKVLVTFGVFLLTNLQITTASHARELLQVRAAFHLSSTVSDGMMSIEQIAQHARTNHIGVVVLADHFLAKIEYGLWPFRRFLKKSISYKSVAHYGIEKYLQEVQRVNEKYPDVVIIPGMEVSPFYYWKGNPWEKNMTLMDWHKQLIITGLFDPEDYKKLPIIHHYTPIRCFDFFKLLWPLLIIFSGTLCFRIRSSQFKGLLGCSFGPPSPKWRIMGIIIIVFGSLLLLNNIPFVKYAWNPYEGDAGKEPYQALINAVEEKGGLTFWADPDEDYLKKRGPILVKTNSYSHLIPETENATGFAAFFEGYDYSAKPGGTWDLALKQYCEGKRKKPIWAIGEFDFERTGQFADYVKDLQLTLLMPSLSTENVLNAFRQGHVYVSQGSYEMDLQLDSFLIQDAHNQSIQGMMGETVNIRSNPHLIIKGSLVDHRQLSTPQEGALHIIRNGDIIKSYPIKPGPFNLAFTDTHNHPSGMVYYRLEIVYSKRILLSNPIFANFHF